MYEGYLKHVHYPNYNLKRCFSQNGGRSRWAQSSPLPSLLPSKQGGGEGGACPGIWSQTATLLSDTGSDFHLLLLKNVKCSLLLAHLRKGALAARPWPRAQQPQPPPLEPIRNVESDLSRCCRIRVCRPSSQVPRPRILQPQCGASLIPVAPAAQALTTGRASALGIQFDAHKTVGFRVHCSTSTEKRARPRWSGSFPDVSHVAGPVLWVTTLSPLLPSRASSRFA